MFTSRAEHRLLLRQDNADLRLRHYGYAAGMIDAARYQRVCDKQRIIEEESKRLSKIYRQSDGKGYPIAQLLCRPENTYSSLLHAYPDVMKDFGEEINFQIELILKYAGYIERQMSEVARLSHAENLKIPPDFDYATVHGLRLEARQKLAKFKPQTVGQAQRISGVSPADISILMIALMRASKE